MLTDEQAIEPHPASLLVGNHRTAKINSDLPAGVATLDGDPDARRTRWVRDEQAHPFRGKALRSSRRRSRKWTPTRPTPRSTTIHISSTAPTTHGDTPPTDPTAR